MWNTTEYDFGNQLEHTRLSANFKYSGQSTIKEIKADCSCTAIASDGGNINVSYKTPEIPAHLKAVGKNYYDLKQVRVFFDDETITVLKIKVTVCQELP